MANHLRYRLNALISTIATKMNYLHDLFVLKATRNVANGHAGLNNRAKMDAWYVDDVLPNKFVGIGGEGSDYGGMLGLLDRNQLALADKEMTVTATISGAGEWNFGYGLDKSLLFNQESNFARITSADATTQLVVLIEHPSSFPNWGTGYWQPFIKWRLLSSGLFKDIKVEMHDGTNWQSPASWDVTNREPNAAGFTMLASEYPNTNNPTKIRFTMKNPILDAGVIYICNVGLKHISHTYAPQYLHRGEGGVVYGDAVFAKDLAVNGRLRVKDKVSLVNSSVLLGDAHGELIICDPSAEITLYLRATGGTPIDRVLKIVNRSGTAVVNLYDYDNSLAIGTVGHGITWEVIYVSAMSAWVKIGEYSNA